jgi:hypothetical protein
MRTRAIVLLFSAPIDDTMTDQPRALSPWMAALWFTGAVVLVHLANQLLDTKPLAAVVAGALIAEFVVQRSKIDLPEPVKPARPLRSPKLEAGIGIALSAVIIGFYVLIGVLTKQATFSKGAWSVDGLLFGVLRSAAVSFRDETLWRWLPLVLALRCTHWRPASAFVVVVSTAGLWLDLPHSLGAIWVQIAMATMSLVLIRGTGKLTTSLAFHGSMNWLYGTFMVSGWGFSWNTGQILPLNSAREVPAYLFGTLVFLMAATLYFRAFAWLPTSWRVQPGDNHIS